MARLTNQLPYVNWRGGRPRFSPGPRERALGWRGHDLKHPDGTWFSFEDAAKFAAARHAEIRAARAAGQQPKIPSPRAAGTRTLAALLADWIEAKSREAVAGMPHALAPSTLRFYRTCIDAILYQPLPRSATFQWRARARAEGRERDPRPREAIADTPVSAIGAPELRAFFNYACARRGHHAAIAMISAISAAFTWGRESPDWRLGRNPRLDMEFARPDGRVRLITLEEFQAFIAAADRMRPSVGDCWYLGLFGGRRQNERLYLKDEGLVDGRRMVRQGKTGKLIPIKDAPQLAARLAAARARVAALKLAKGTRPDTIVVNEDTGLPYNVTTYRHAVAQIRAEAAKACPSIVTARDQDLRDTCVILLDRAGVDILRICEITGHSYYSIEMIRKSYLGHNNPQAADAAIDQLAAYIAREAAL